MSKLRKSQSVKLAIGFSPCNSFISSNSLLAIISCYRYRRRTIIIDNDIKLDGSAADLAILNVLLRLDRAIDKHNNRFPAPGALNIGFGQLIMTHWRGRMRMILPLSVDR